MKKIKKESMIVNRRPPVLRFSPTAWAKLLHLRDAGDTEIGGFGVTPADDLLFVEDIRLVQQNCSWASVEFDDEAVADFFDVEVDSGRLPEQFARIWCHTHPGNSPRPSGTDEATFTRVFGRSDWALMFILARGGQCYARLRYNVGPGSDVELPVEVDYGRTFEGSDVDRLQEEYLAKVRVPPPELPKHAANENDLQLAAKLNDGFVDAWRPDAEWRDAWGDYVDFDRHEQEAAYGYIRDF